MSMKQNNDVSALVIGLSLILMLTACGKSEPEPAAKH